VWLGSRFGDRRTFGARVLALVLGVLVEEVVVVGGVIRIGVLGGGRVVLVRERRVCSCLLGERESRMVGRIVVLSHQTSRMWGGSHLVVAREEAVVSFADCSYFVEMAVRN